MTRPPTSSSEGIPLLVLVTGAPGAGKTTLARRLAPALRLPLVAKDDIKESLGDSLEVTTIDWSRRVGAATMELLFVLMERFMSAGASAVFESNFYPEIHRARLMGLRDVHPFMPVEVHCTADAVTLTHRVRTRDRHPVHHSNSPTVHTMAEWIGKNGPLELNEHVIRVDTAMPEPVDLDAIVHKVREAGHGL